jgi:hypothetical protein
MQPGRQETLQTPVIVVGRWLSYHELNMTTRDEPAVFKARANLVQVPVVVRGLPALR